MSSGEWWHAFYGAFRPVFGLVSPQETNAQVRYLRRKLGLRPGSRFLDCPCGIGRVAVPLARAGVRVTGVDIMPEYLAELQRKAERAGKRIETVHADMRRIDFKDRFDAGGNLWTSFGFFERETDHLLTLKRMFRALKPGGRFVLHVINRDWIMVNFQPRGWYEFGDWRIFEERMFDYERSNSRSRWHFLKDGREEVYESNLRAFSPHELLSLFERAGFVDIEAFGSIKDEPVDRTRRMMWVFGTKPK